MWTCGGRGQHGGVKFVARVEPDNQLVSVSYAYLPDRGFVYSRRESILPFPIEIFPFANGRSSGRNLPVSQNLCIFTGVESDFENFDNINMCVSAVTTERSISTQFSVIVAHMDDWTSGVTQPYYCTRMN